MKKSRSGWNNSKCCGIFIRADRSLRVDGHISDWPEPKIPQRFPGELKNRIKDLRVFHFPKFPEKQFCDLCWRELAPAQIVKHYSFFPLDFFISLSVVNSFLLSILDSRRARACAPYLNLVPDSTLWVGRWGPSPPGSSAWLIKRDLTTSLRLRNGDRAREARNVYIIFLTRTYLEKPMFHEFIIGH